MILGKVNSILQQQPKVTLRSKSLKVLIVLSLRSKTHNTFRSSGPLRDSYPGFSAKSFFGGKVTKEFVNFLAEMKEEEDEEDEGE